jgi:hypothetical protein
MNSTQNLRGNSMKLARGFITGLMGAAFSMSQVIAAEVPYSIILDGLQNPRGLTFDREGSLYVSQVGSGGNTGVITEIPDPWRVHPSAVDIVTNLPSVADGGGGFAGVSGLSVGPEGTLYAIMGLVYAAPPPTQSPLGDLLSINRHGRVHDLAQVANFDFTWFLDRPDLGDPSDREANPYGSDANPYAVLAMPDALYVVDAATNTLDRVRRDGKIDIIAYFPGNTFADATPTCIARGPDGAFYIGTLALVDSLFAAAPTPAAIVYRVEPWKANPHDVHTVFTLAKPWATGLWPINGCAFGPDGDFYASELSNDPSLVVGGDVVKISFEHPQKHVSLTNFALSTPGGVAVSRDGTVYVANATAYFPTGQVLRLTKH